MNNAQLVAHLEDNRHMVFNVASSDLATVPYHATRVTETPREIPLANLDDMLDTLHILYAGSPEVDVTMTLSRDNVISMHLFHAW